MSSYRNTVLVGLISLVIITAGLGARAQSSVSPGASGWTNNAGVVWNWITQHVVQATASSANGYVTGNTDDWMDAGSTAVITGVANQYYVLTGWSGDTNGCIGEGSTLYAPMTQPRVLVAWFTAMLASNGVPVWWLAEHGLTNGWDAEALADQDHDGLATWQEWRADTDPTNACSVLKFSAAQVEGGGVRVSWQGGSLATQYLDWCEGTWSGSAWQTTFTNLPPTPTATSHVVNSAGTTGACRVRAER